jgi:hypothetical protein
MIFKDLSCLGIQSVEVVYFTTSHESDPLFEARQCFTCEAKPREENTIELRNGLSRQVLNNTFHHDENNGKKEFS